MFEIGVDIEKVSRFEGKTLEKDEHFLKTIFTDKELEKSFSNSKAKTAQHLCARYCAKEAAVKALSALGISNLQYKDIEILNKENGAPYIFLKKFSNISIKVSLSHTVDNAIAFVTCEEV